MVDDETIAALCVASSGYAELAGPTGRATHNTFQARLAFADSALPEIQFRDFVAGPLLALGLIAIIGRNALKDFVLTYDGRVGEITVTW